MYMQCSSLYASKTTHVYVYKSSSVNAMHVTILNKYISKLDWNYLSLTFLCDN